MTDEDNEIVEEMNVDIDAPFNELLESQDWVREFPFKDHYYDLGAHFMRNHSYSDWEGAAFTDPNEAANHVRWINEAIGQPNPNYPEQNRIDLMAKDITFKFIMENIAAAGIEEAPTEQETKWIAWAYQDLLGGSRLIADPSGGVDWETGELHFDTEESTAECPEHGKQHVTGDATGDYEGTAEMLTCGHHVQWDTEAQAYRIVWSNPLFEGVEIPPVE